MKPLLLHLVGYLYYWQMEFNSVFKGLNWGGGTVSLKAMSLPGCITGGFVIGCAGVGDGFCVGAFVDGAFVDGAFVDGAFVDGGSGGLIGSPLCMVLSGQSRLAEVHF